MAVYKDTNGTYYVRLWYKTWKGERKQKTKRGFEKQKDAKKWEREFLSIDHEADSLKMSTLVQLFTDDLDNKCALGKLRQTTVNNKKHNIELYIQDYFGDAYAENVSIDVVNKWISHITTNSIRKDRLCSSTIIVIRNILSQIFDFGIKHQGLKFNPVKQSDAPAPYTSDQRADMWETKDYNIFYDSLKKERDRVLFNVLYWAGLRIGEALSLTPQDIDGNNIIVNKTRIYVNKDNKYIYLPKSLNSFRTILIPKFLADQLKAYIDTIDVKPTDRIFPIERQNVADLMKNRIKKLGLPKASPHTMRHSYVSNFLSKTKDFVAAAAQAGDTVNTISTFYAHAPKESISSAVEKLEELHKNS